MLICWNELSGAVKLQRTSDHSEYLTIVKDENMTQKKPTVET